MKINLHSADFNPECNVYRLADMAKYPSEHLLRDFDLCDGVGAHLLEKTACLSTGCPGKLIFVVVAEMAISVVVLREP